FQMLDPVLAAAAVGVAVYVDGDGLGCLSEAGEQGGGEQQTVYGKSSEQNGGRIPPGHDLPKRQHVNECSSWLRAMYGVCERTKQRRIGSDRVRGARVIRGASDACCPFRADHPGRDYGGLEPGLLAAAL